MQLLLQNAQVSYKREQVGFSGLLTKGSVLICLIYTENSSQGEQEKHAKMWEKAMDRREKQMVSKSEKWFVL